MPPSRPGRWWRRWMSRQSLADSEGGAASPPVPVKKRRHTDGAFALSTLVGVTSSVPFRNHGGGGGI